MLFKEETSSVIIIFSHMNQEILKCAQICKSISDSIELTQIVVANRISFRVRGDLKHFERVLIDLRDALMEKYPVIALSLQHHVDNYDNNHIYHQGAIDAIIENVIALEYCAQDKKKIFISHSSKDRPIISDFVDRILCLGIGIEANDIFCTSIEDMTMNNGEDIRKHIKENIQSADFSLLMISDNYKESEVCQNELGAVWAVDNNVRYFMLPNTTFDKIGWLGSPNKAEEVNNPVYLDRFQRELKEYYKLGYNPSWSRQRESFIESLRN